MPRLLLISSRYKLWCGYYSRTANYYLRAAYSTFSVCVGVATIRSEVLVHFFPCAESFSACSGVATIREQHLINHIWYTGSTVYDDSYILRHADTTRMLINNWEHYLSLVPNLSREQSWERGYHYPNSHDTKGLVKG